MADGKILFEASTDTKQALQGLAELEKEYKKATSEVEKLSAKLDALAKKRITLGGNDEINKQIKDAEKDLDSLYKKSAELDAKRDAKLLEGKQFAPNLKKLNRLDEFSQQPNANPGLIVANAKKWGVDLDEFERYKAYLEEFNKLSTETTGIENQIAQTKQLILQLEERRSALQTSEKSQEELDTEEKLQEALRRRQELEQEIQNQKDDISESEKVRQEYEQEAAILGKVASVARAAGSAIRTFVSLLAKGAVMGLKFVKSITIDRVANGFKKASTGVKRFGQRLKYVILQGLIFRNLRKYLSELMSEFGNALKQNEQLNSSIANLKGTMWSALAPVIDAIAPILARFIDLIARLITYLSGLVSILFGIGKASKDAGKQLANAGKKGKEAGNNLASWDTIQNLDNGSNNSDDEIAPTFDQDFDEAYNALEEFKKLFEEGDWYKIGYYLGEQLNTIIEDIDNWITSELSPRLAEIGENFGKFLNGLFDGLDWDLLGSTISHGLNGVINALATFYEEFNGLQFGVDIGNMLNGLFREFDAARLADFVSEWVKDALGTIVGILEQTDWQLLGNKVAEFIRNIQWSELASALFEGIGAALGALASFLWGLIENAWSEVIAWWNEVAFEDGQFTIEGLLNGILEAIKNIYKWIYDNIFKPFIDGFKKAFGIHSPSKVMEEQGNFITEGLFAGIKNKISDILTWIKKNILEPLVNAINTFISNAILRWNEFKKTVSDVWIAIKRAVSEKIQAIRETVWNAVSKIKEWWEGVKTKLSNVWIAIKKGVSEKVQSIREIVWTAVSKIKGWWDDVKTKVNGVWGSIKKKASEAWEGIKSVFKAVPEWFGGKFKSAWEAVKKVFSTGGRIFSGIKDGIVNAFVSVVNAIIDGINRVISIPFNAINDVLKSIKNVNILGVKPFTWIGTISIPQIPKLQLPAQSSGRGGGGGGTQYAGVRSIGDIGGMARLAQGTVVNPGHEFAAILGDNRYEQEVVSPLSTMKEAFMEALQESGINGNGQVILELDGRKLATAIVPHINNQSRAYGRSVIL